MNYLAIHRNSLNSLFAGDIQLVRTRIKKELSNKDFVWIQPMVCWIPFYRTKETSGILLPVIRKKNEEPIATIVTSFVDVSKAFFQSGKLPYLTDKIYCSLLTYNLQIAYFRCMEGWGQNFYVNANYMETLYHNTYALRGEVPWSTSPSTILNKDMKFVIHPWLINTDESRSGLRLYLCYFTDWTNVVSHWVETEDTTWYNRMMLLLPKDTYDNYYISRMPRMHEQNFPDALTRFLHAPGNKELLEIIHACADVHDILLRK